jgi:hypothetical protein
MDYQDIMLNGENLSVPLWRCALCGAEGETATADGARTTVFDHVRSAHPDEPIVLPGEHN